MLEAPLQLTWGISKALFYGHETLMPYSSYYSINKRAHLALINKYFSLNIYKALKKAEKDKSNLTEEQQRLLKKYILECEMAGLALKESKRDNIVGHSRSIDLNTDNFKSKVEIAEKLFKHKIDDPSLMKDFPVDFLKAVAVKPLEYEVGPWVINLNPNVVKIFLGKFIKLFK
jgi:Zn-dependent oligopeptidase